ncbi:MAG TPA: hypothetical protein VGY55_00095, partial [Pirellulales bacterium]|nr:hypothetical protein [Pirellulales bacterium]
MIPGPSLHSVSGVQLDGASSGTPGTDYVRDFTVVDPLTVINTNDSGPGSLRAAILYANTLAGTTHTITFAIPAGPQSINLLSPLPATTVAVVALMDATQNVTVHSPVESGVDHFNAVSKIGAGTLTIAGRNSLSGPFAVHDGRLILTNSTAPQLAGVGVTVDGAATLELAGSISDLAGGSAGINIANTSTATAGVVVSGVNQVVGGIDGTGSVTIDAGSDLTANHINQTALVIGGTSTSFATVTIAPSDSTGNPLISSAATSSSNSSVSALSVSGSGNASTEVTRIERLAATRSRRLAPQLVASPVSPGANDSTSAVTLPAVVGSATASTSATASIVSTTANVIPVDSVSVELHRDRSFKSAAIAIVAGFNPGTPDGDNSFSIVPADTNGATSSVASQTGSSEIKDAAAARKMLDADAVATAFGADDWEWFGSEPATMQPHSSTDDAGGLLLVDDLLEAIGKEWGN